jgi:uncharacterized RDD family membrane protein YckC
MNETNIATEPNIGSRFLAGLIDYIIIFVFLYFVFVRIGEPNDEGGYTLSGFQTLYPMIFWGVITVGFEQLFGATLGNLLIGLKPVSIRKSADNLTFSKIEEKLTFGQSLKRHLLDPIDMFFFGLIGVITIKNTDKNQRLGDIWGNTIVVKVIEKKNK